ncbi:ABC transporter substrate-binding protein [Ruegeria hyattellae]|uniref:ABC transporter substrate-binding protein n=1 Tax=Ruegeria hyattellae TaxID=3233337 RepID=UPI00355C3433
MTLINRNKLCAGVAALAVTAGAASAKDNELTFLGLWALFDFSRASMEELEAKFEDQNDGWDFNRNDVPFEQTLQQATSAHLAGTSTDILQTVAGNVPALVGIGSLAPLNDLFTEEEWAKLPPTTLASVSVDGQIYGMPWVPGPILPFYNRDLLQEAGLNSDNPPQTWDEMIAAMKAVCALPDTDAGPVYGLAMRSDRIGNSAQWSIPIIYGLGGDVIDEEGKPLFNTPEVVEAWTLLQEMAADECVPIGLSIQESRSLFASGRAAFAFEGPWGAGLFNNLSGGALEVAPDGNVWVSQMPADKNGNVRTIGNPHHLTISVNSPNKEVAAELIRFATTNQEFADNFFKASNLLGSANSEVLSSGAHAESEYAQVFVEALPSTIDNPIFHAKFGAMMDEWVEGLQKVLAGADPATELEAVDKRVSRLTRR